MPKQLLALINMDRRQTKYFLFENEITDCEEIEKKLFDDDDANIISLQWEDFDNYVKQKLNCTRVDECDIPEGTPCHWVKLRD